MYLLKVKSEAAVYMAAVLEYVVAEVDNVVGSPFISSRGIYSL